MEFIDKDLSGRVIDQPSKTSKSVEIEGNSRFCGHRFKLRGRTFGDKRCIYCGNWFHWDQQKDGLKWIRQANIDTYNLDKNVEPLHCGKQHCEDYHYKCEQVKIKKAAEAEKLNEHRMIEAFKEFKKQGLVC